MCKHTTSYHECLCLLWTLRSVPCVGWCTCWFVWKGFAPAQDSTFFQIINTQVCLTMWHFHRPSNSRVSVFSTRNFLWHLKGLENVFFKQAIIWLFFGREVFNISGFLMEACLKAADDILRWLEVEKNPVFGTKARYSKHWKRDHAPRSRCV